MNIEDENINWAPENDEGDEGWTEPQHSRRINSRKLLIFIILFILIENLVIPPRYQVSNNIALAGVWLYQNSASLVFRKSGVIRCRFYPSCSEYSRLSLLHYGFLRGSVMAIWRILRCNPLNQGPHEDWPYEGAWEHCRQFLPEYIDLPDDVHLPPDATGS